MSPAPAAAAPAGMPAPRRSTYRLIGMLIQTAQGPIFFYLKKEEKRAAKLIGEHEFTAHAVDQVTESPKGSILVKTKEGLTEYALCPYQAYLYEVLIPVEGGPEIVS